MSAWSPLAASYRLLLVLPVLVLPVLILAEQSSPAANSDCPFDGGRTRAVERERWGELSGLSERLGRNRPAIRDGSSPIPRRNFIDEELFATMERDGIKPTVIASDQEFLRRVTLDLTGRIPDTPTVRAFLADNTPDKRSRMISQLAVSTAFADRWTMWFGDLVQNVQFSSSGRQFPQGRNAFYLFIRDSFRADKPYDALVREVLAGTGDNFAVGPANYIVRQIQPNGPIQDTYDNLSAHSGERFLGLPLNCLSCHDGLRHLEQVNAYLSTRKRMDFWKNAAFFARTTARRVNDEANNTVRYQVANSDSGEYRLNTVSGNKSPRQPQSGQPNFVSPAFFLTGQSPVPGQPWREAYGQFLTADPQFARATVNYVWREMFGLALVEPADSIDLLRIDPANLPPGATLQTLHPELLTRLSDWFRANGYSIRALVTLIADSSAYQLSMAYARGTWNESWTPYFARRYARRLSSEMLFDAICQSTGVAAPMEPRFLGTVSGAMQLPDTTEPARSPNARFLDSFGRGDRDETPRTDDTSITQSLMLLNDTVVTTRVRQNVQGSTLQRVLAGSREPARVAEELYLATLSRYPTNEELPTAMSYLKSGEIGRKAEDLQYALINSLEFLFK